MIKQKLTKIEKFCIDVVENKLVSAAFWSIIITVAICLLISVVIIIANVGNIGNFNNVTKTGSLGDSLNGLMGPLIAILVAILTFFAFYIQYKANELQKTFNSNQEEKNDVSKFENNFFELIRLHRENVNETEYTKYHNETLKIGKSRKAFKIILEEFTECLKEVRHFSNSKNPDDFLNKKYKEKVESMIDENQLEIRLIDYVTIELAYCIVYYGLNVEGKMILKKQFIGKYNDEYFNHLLNYMTLKPKEENTYNFELWKTLYRKEYREFRQSLHNLYNYDKPNRRIELNEFEMKILQNYLLEKYYSGHQHRLGHYFRHLFQTYKFLDAQDFLKPNEKYFYGKTLRAQLSTSEQGLLFINSITCLGLRWELAPDENGKSNKLISDYNLIANLPSTHIYRIYYRDYYPNVKYEIDDY